MRRRAIEDALIDSRRQQLSSQVLQVLSTRAPEQVARLVHHAAQANDTGSVLKFAPLAAQQAASLNAHREAASHYRTALQFGEALPPEKLVTLFEGRSYECYLTQQIEEALDARGSALQIWEELGEPIKQGDGLRWMSRLSWFLGRKPEADRYAIESIRILESLEPSRELAMAYSNRAQLYALAEESSEAVHWGSRAIELAERFGDAETLAHALNNVGIAKWLLHDETGRESLKQSLQLSLTNDFQEHAARAYTNLGSRETIDRNYEAALSYLNDGIAYSVAHDLDSWTLYMTAWRARIYLEQGIWSCAADDATRVLDDRRAAVITRIPALAVLGRLRVRRGDPDAASVLDEARDLAHQTEELQRIVPVVAARAEAAWLRDDKQQILDAVSASFELARRRPTPWTIGELGFWMWRGGGLEDPPEGAASPYALHINGDWKAAAEGWKRLGCPYECALALADGDQPAQKTALDMFERLGATPAADMLKKKLRSSGVRGLSRGARPTTKENPAGLTVRQMEVLGLLAEGLSNAEIASKLFISTKTVDHHVSAILAKLEAHSRAEAVAFARQSNLLDQNRERPVSN